MNTASIIRPLSHSIYWGIFREWRKQNQGGVLLRPRFGDAAIQEKIEYCKNLAGPYRDEIRDGMSLLNVLDIESVLYFDRKTVNTKKYGNVSILFLTLMRSEEYEIRFETAFDDDEEHNMCDKMILTSLTDRPADEYLMDLSLRLAGMPL